ncbi:MAG: PEGA domain-containing protein [Candidatus Hydrogenedentota bacterium]|nr:MAG: PEGA domain-containing protein [Candidatus Hydrogenedentota bacterium]
MKNSYVARQVPLVSFFVLVSIVITSACATGRHETSMEHTSRTWNLSYVETLQVNTKPSDCRVYIDDQFVGMSPVEFEIDCGEVVVRQDGIYIVTKDVSYDKWGFPKNETVDTSPTTWGKLSCFLAGSREIRIETFCDGYEPATEIVEVSGKCSSFLHAVDNLEASAGDELPSVLTGYRPVVITLKPVATPIQPRQERPEQQQQQRALAVPGQYDEPGEHGDVIMVSSTPPDADVFVDGDFVGNSPCKLRLRAGIHIIEVKKDGYSPYRREIKVLGGSELTIKAILNANR